MELTESPSSFLPVVHKSKAIPFPSGLIVNEKQFMGNVSHPTDFNNFFRFALLHLLQHNNHNTLILRGVRA